MNEGNMENSSLELYETAYNLHYVEGNLSDACRIYKAIIDEFPDSNECGYAVIQLQKIQANEIAEKIKTVKSTNIPVVIAVVCTLICVVVMLIALISIKKVDSEIEAVSMVSQALCMVYAGNNDEALEILGRVKTFTKGNMSAPYLLSAGIYADMRQYEAAKADFEKYRKLTGGSDTIFKKMVAEKSEKDKIVPAVKIDSTKNQAVSSAADATFKPVQNDKTAQTPAGKQRPKMEKQRAQRSLKKSVNADSISFF
jgi:tetratricopeptide (TPR) repeat protein